MKRRRIIFVALLVVVLSGVAWMMLSPDPREPLYDGKPVSYWIRRPRFSDIGRHFPKMDSNAVPFLIKELDTRQGLLQKAFAGVLPKLPRWIQDRFPKPVNSWWVRENAAAALYELGSDAEPAIPALVRVLKEDENQLVRLMAVAALRGAHNGASKDNKKQITVGLIEAARNDKATVVRLSAIRSVHEIDPEAAAKAGLK